MQRVEFGFAIFAVATVFGIRVALAFYDSSLVLKHIENLRLVAYIL